ncbi:hypothetical protein BH09VER1_BH09VER1_45640 [soil metagenome]
MRPYFLDGRKVNPGQYFFGGGGAPKPPKQEKVKLPKQPDIPVPVAPKPLPPAPPTPTQANSEVEQAAADQRKQALNRKGMRQTLLAGETGGYSPATDQKKTLLG